MEKNTKKKYIIIAAVLIAVIILVLLVILLNKEEAYRVVKIYELDGKATVTREKTGEIDIYPNMVLTSGDEVYLQEGVMTLKLDEDKYVYVEENTRFSLLATGNAADSKTSIHLMEGAIINEIQSPLAEDASYEVHTQNSSMSVRGTTFRVAIYYDEDGTLYTKVSVFEGKVETQLVFKDGTKADPRVVEFGKETIIFEDDTNTDYLDGITDIKYEELSVKAVERLIGFVKEGMTLSVSEDYLSGVLSLLKGENGEDSKEEKRDNKKDDNDTPETDGKQEEQNDSTQEDSEGGTGNKPIEQPEEKSGIDSSQTNQGSDTEPGTSQEEDLGEEESEEEEAGEESEGEESEEEEAGEESEGEESEEEEADTYTVTFMYDGTKFATQTVTSGECASQPLLMPAKTGSWDYDFSAAITKDTTINWK